MTATSRRLYTRLRAAEYLDMSLRRLDEKTRAGDIAAKRDGANVKYDVAELDRYAASLPDYEPRNAS